MRMKRVAEFSTPVDAEREDRAQEWAKTPQERLRDLEVLRQQRYPNGIAPRLQRIAELLECSPG
jgi:hypothetical protein